MNNVGFGHAFYKETRSQDKLFFVKNKFLMIQKHAFSERETRLVGGNIEHTLRCPLCFENMFVFLCSQLIKSLKRYVYLNICTKNKNIR